MNWGRADTIQSITDIKTTRKTINTISVHQEKQTGCKPEGSCWWLVTMSSLIIGGILTHLDMWLLL